MEDRGSPSSIFNFPSSTPFAPMKIAYGDLIGGLSGDMFVAALLDLGLPLNKLRTELKKIPTLKFELNSVKKSVHAVRATRFQVGCPKIEPPRSCRDIKRL